jgi:uncharacterized protein YbbC (DUF1343 family)
MHAISYGIDRLLKKNIFFLKNKRWGLVTNDAATTTGLVPVRKALLDAGVNIAVLFSPEHGLGANGVDGAAMPNQKDRLTGLNVISLYGDSLKPPPSVLAGLDGILFDLPEVGLRFYTYIWTLSHIMEACEISKIPLIILDRPNPLSGQLALAEGPMLMEEQLSSFIGRWRMPIRYSLTIGELALFFKQKRQLKGLELTIIPVEGWQRHLFFSQLGLPFVPPSPAISSIETLLTYPALCFLESVNVSEGRGTAFPFRVCGAPWVDSLVLSDAFNQVGFLGVQSRPFSFTPTEGGYKNQRCNGIMLHVTDVQTFRPVSVGFGLIALHKTLFLTDFAWSTYPTHVNKTGKNHFDLLVGDPSVRALLESNPSFFLKKDNTFTEISDWATEVRPFLLYE